LPAGQLGRDRLGYSAGGLGVAEVVEQQRHREYGGDRVGQALAGDVRRGAMHRLEHGRVRPFRVDAATGGQPDAAGDRGGDVGEDVTEEVVSDHHVVPLRLGDQVHRGGVHVL